MKKKCNKFALQILIYILIHIRLLTVSFFSGLSSVYFL